MVALALFCMECLSCRLEMIAFSLFMIARMDSKAVLFCAFNFWPGFQKLWVKGDFHSLLVSLLFGWVLGITWLATFVWPEWLVAFFSPDWFARLILVALWFSIATVSFLSAIGVILSLSDPNGLAASARQSNFETAQVMYLQANYFEAERLLRKNMLGNIEDIESSLLWIAILRRTRRISQALDLISSVVKLDAAQLWMSELRSEKAQCLRIKIQTPPAHD